MQEAPEFRSWALAELLCSESQKVAPEGSERALELAELAVLVARLTTGEERWLARLEAYCVAHLGDARRLHGDVRGAEEALSLANRLWQIYERPEDSDRTAEVVRRLLRDFRRQTSGRPE